MHELSIAEAAWARARELTPSGAVLRAVKLRAGPMRGIDPEALQSAWAAVTRPAGVALDVAVSPWRLRCPECGTEFDAEDVMSPCWCGGTRAFPVHGDELRLVSLTVDDPPAAPGPATADAPRPKPARLWRPPHSDDGDETSPRARVRGAT